MIYADNTAEVITASPTFPVTLAGAVTGYRSFSTAYGATSANIPLVLRKTDGSAWMTFVGDYNHSNGTIAYTAMLSSSTGSQVLPTSGVWTVSVDMLAAHAEKILIIPPNSQSTNYTCILSDAGKQILHPSSDDNARTFTIPANSSLAYPVGTCITFINRINTLTIAVTTDTMYLANSATTGNRTLAANGIATAIKVESTVWLISGTGLT